MTITIEPETTGTPVVRLVRERDALVVRSEEAYGRSQEAEAATSDHCDKDPKSQQVFFEAFKEAEEACTELDCELTKVVRTILTEPPQSAADIALQVNTIRYAISTDENLGDFQDEILAFADGAAGPAGLTEAGIPPQDQHRTR